MEHGGIDLGVMGRSAKQRRLRGGSVGWRATERPPVLGLDVGGVLVDRVAEGSDTSFFGGQPMDTPAVAGALEAIPKLVTLFEHRVHIVSKAGPKIAELTRCWLGARGAVGPEGIDPANVHFVRKRPEKHPVCDQLGVTHFVDDRLGLPRVEGTSDLACPRGRPGRMFRCPSPIRRSSATMS